jgi:hypothetical protein
MHLQILQPSKIDGSLELIVGNCAFENFIYILTW